MKINISIKLPLKAQHDVLVTTNTQGHHCQKGLLFRVITRRAVYHCCVTTSEDLYSDELNPNIPGLSHYVAPQEKNDTTAKQFVKRMK